jgi:choline dehydrogenase-like flavoprotein
MTKNYLASDKVAPCFDYVIVGAGSGGCVVRLFVAQKRFCTGSGARSSYASTR